MMNLSTFLSAQHQGPQGLAALYGGAIAGPASGDGLGGFGRLLASLPAAQMSLDGAPGPLTTLVVAGAPAPSPIAGSETLPGTAAPAALDIAIGTDLEADDMTDPVTPTPTAAAEPASDPTETATKLAENLLKAHAAKAAKDSGVVDTDTANPNIEQPTDDPVLSTEIEAAAAPFQAAPLDGNAAPESVAAPAAPAAAAVTTSVVDPAVPAAPAAPSAAAAVPAAVAAGNALKSSEAPVTKSKDVSAKSAPQSASRGPRQVSDNRPGEEARATNRANATPVLPSSAKAADHASSMSAVLAAATDRGRPAPAASDAGSMAVLLHRPESAPLAGSSNIAAPVAVAEGLLDMTSDDVWIDQLARDIIATKSDSGDISFRLMPRHLGRLDVAIRMGDDGVALKLDTHHEATATILNAAQGRLVEELRQQGVRVAGAEVTCTPGETGRQSQQGQGRAATADAAHLIETATDRAEPREEKRAADRRGRFA